jgi:hypothetical protein
VAHHLRHLRMSNHAHGASEGDRNYCADREVSPECRT